MLCLRVNRLLTLVIRKALRPLKLTRELWLLLEIIALGSNRVTELAQSVDGPKGSVSRRITKLEQLELIVHRPTVGDRREKRVQITPFGWDQLDRARERIEKGMVHLDLVFSEAERDTLRKLCQQLLHMRSDRTRRQSR